MAAGLGCGVILAGYAVFGHAPEPASAGPTRGLGAIINGVMEILGPTGAAVTFLIFGAILAAISAAMCPSAQS